MEITTIDFITRELSTTPKEILQRCRNRNIVKKRWIIMCFYRLMGLSTVKIGNFLNLDHQTVLHGLRKADAESKEKAKELYLKFTNQEPDDTILPHKTKTIRVPDYRTSKIITKEVEI